MSILRIYSIFLRQFFLIKSNPIRLIGLFLWQIIAIIQWGFISKYLGSMGQATFGFITVILGAVILWEFMVRIQQGIMTAFLEDIWSQNFINYFGSPLKISEYLSGLILTSITTALIGFMILILIAGLGFGYNVFKLGLLLFPFIFILFIFGIAMGIFVTALIFKFGPAAEWLGWPIPAVMSLIAGVFYPISTLPSFLNFLAKLIPVSYIFESIRQILSASFLYRDITTSMITAFLLALIYLFIAYKVFISVYRLNLKNGTIARFNAELFGS